MMRDRVLVDNDVLLKTAAWRLGEALVEALTVPGQGTPGMLAVGRFVVRRRLARQPLNDSAAASAAFEALCEALEQLEPESEELAVAAALEEAATRAGLEFDTGESQLVAMLLIREARLLLTGDKRAIVAVASLQPEGLGARLGSLEQLVQVLIDRLGVEAIRAAICAERQADTALAICFACHHESCSRAEVYEGIASYCGDLAGKAGVFLIADAELSALAA